MARLFQQVMCATFPDDDPARYATHLFGQYIAGETIWVAQADATIVGLISLWPSPPFIHFLLIADGWRRQGLGARLIAAATAGIDGPVDLKCRLDNPAAQRFYKSLGWQEVDRDLVDPEPFIRYRRE